MENEKRISGITEVDKCLNSCRQAAIYSRLNLLLYLTGLKAKSGTIDEQDAEEILETLTLAREGFTLYKKSSDFTKPQARDLVTNTSPQSISEEFRKWGYIIKPKDQLILNATKEGTAYKTLRIALRQLESKNEVMFADFAELPDNLNLGSTEFRPTFWGKNYDAEGVWFELNDIYKNTHRLLFNPQNIQSDDLLRIGHLFTAAVNIHSK